MRIKASLLWVRADLSRKIENSIMGNVTEALSKN